MGITLPTGVTRVGYSLPFMDLGWVILSRSWTSGGYLSLLYLRVGYLSLLYLRVGYLSCCVPPRVGFSRCVPPRVGKPLPVVNPEVGKPLPVVNPEVGISPVDVLRDENGVDHAER